MLLKIREKVQGVFASIILILICVLFGLWGIQNYLGGGKEIPVATVGDRDFYQNEVTQAYQQFAQNLAGMKFDEENIKQQALDKLIRDEVLLQYVQDQHLVVADETAKAFIQTLEYFHKDGKFDKGQYQALLNSQGMSSGEFVNRIKKALVMDQLQRAVVDSAFVTQAEITNFFRIQNQKRDVEYLTIPVNRLTLTPSDQEIADYYQQHQQQFHTEEQVSIDYVELSLDKLASDIKVNDEQLRSYYEEQKGQYTTPERRKISHILFAFTKDTADDNQALDRAQKARQSLHNKDFAALAAEVSDDKLTASKGGDLGLFNIGVMEKAFEDAASSLKLGEVSQPVKSAFGYHLIKVTELVPGEVKPFDAVKAELTKAYQKSQAESAFTVQGERLATISFENPDSLQAVAEALKLEIQKTPLFTRASGKAIAAEDKVRQVAFSDEVLKGSNSEPVEISSDKVVVLRINQHLAAQAKPLEAVKMEIIGALQIEQARRAVTDNVAKAKAELQNGKSLADIATGQHWTLKKVSGVSRMSAELTPAIKQAVFSAAKPKSLPTLVVVDEADGAKTLVNVTKVEEGQLTDPDKAKLATIGKNIAASFGKSQFEALLTTLQTNADITIYPAKQ